jgi:hypothetical protein
MIRALIFTIFSLLALSACTQRLVCPAYQSAFIYDQNELRKKFSYFQEDSTPKVLTASKNKYLIAEEVSYKKKLASMATVEMKDVNPKVPDSLTLDGDVSLAELDLAARSVIDSTYIVDVARDADSLVTDEDSVYVITKDKELRYLRYNKDSIQYRVNDIRLNVDQDNYMWYLRDWLVLPDVRLAQQQGSAKGEKAAKKKGKGIKGFFSNFFRKKKKAPLDSLQTAEPPVERSEFDFDYQDLDGGQNTEAEDQPAEKKKFYLLKKRKGSTDGEDQPAKPKKEKRSRKPKTQPAEEQPAEEEEEKDDGF